MENEVTFGTEATEALVHLLAESAARLDGNEANANVVASLRDWASAIIDARYTNGRIDLEE